MARLLHSRLMLAFLAAITLFGTVALMRPASASAHPLGNFTVNHYTRIDVTADGITLFRVLDMAEIPTFQERQRMDADGDGEVSAAESEAWAAPRADALAAGMVLASDGKALELTPLDHNLTFPDGQAGLSLLRFEVTYTAPLPDGWREGHLALTFEDANEDGRIGWREVVVRGGPGIELAQSSVPAAGVSDELRAYPAGELGSRLDVRAATFSIREGAGAPLPAAATQAERATRGNPDGTLARFAGLAGKDELTPGVIAVALLAAVGFGALHALSPGHGKTVVAAYLVGSRGTWRHALLLGLTVTVTHTSSVYLLGFVTLYLSEFIVPERLYPWLGVTSGALILGMGAMLLVSRARASGVTRGAADRARAWLGRPAPGAVLAGEAGALVMAMPHPHEHAERVAHAHADAAAQAHPHGAASHSHGLGPAHSHAMPGQDGEPVTWRRLVGLGVFGGMIPCPSAIVVMLSAIALHRVGFGLLLIVAFSIGLAGVLTAIGFALVFARTLSSRVPLLRRLADQAGRDDGMAAVAVRFFPLASAGAVVIAGLVITLRAVGQAG